jgi:hypothetical protein
MSDRTDYYLIYLIPLRPRCAGHRTEASREEILNSDLGLLLPSSFLACNNYRTDVKLLRLSLRLPQLLDCHINRDALAYVNEQSLRRQTRGRQSAALARLDCMPRCRGYSPYWVIHSESHFTVGSVIRTCPAEF